MTGTLWRKSAVNILAIYVAHAYGQQSVSIQSADPTLFVCYKHRVLCNFEGKSYFQHHTLSHCTYFTYYTWYSTKPMQFQS